MWKLVKFFQFLYSNDTSLSIIFQPYISNNSVSVKEEGRHEHAKEEVVLKGRGTQLTATWKANISSCLDSRGTDEISLYLYYKKILD